MSGALQAVFQNLRSFAVPVGWIGLLSGTTGVANSGVVDSSGNVYAFGTVDFANFQLAKYDNTGAIQWQRKLTLPEGSGNSIAVDSSSNVYVFGTSSNTVTLDFQIAKYNSSGTIQWQRRFGGATSIQEFGRSIAIDSSANIYMCGKSNASGAEDIQIAKYDSSGAIQWQRRLGNAIACEGRGIAVDSSSNVYVVGSQFVTSPSVNYHIQIAKYNSSGTIQWQRSLSSTRSEQAYAVAVDSSSNVYICGTAEDSGASDIFQIAKYNSSGTLQWQRSLTGGSSNPRAITVDSSSNVYVCGYSTNSGSNNVQIAKYNSSGTIQWQRILGSNTIELGFGITVDSSNKIYVFGRSRASGTDNILLAKLPDDGTPTGTYTVGSYSFTYAASSLTDASTSLTDASSSLTDASTSLTDSASTFTDSASTLTSTVGNI
jgi:uncharacterized delta-60 repeat protein